ncbi:MAG: hypothetical protein Q8S02_08670 [Hydrogenophaga sp.]|nr:hypothetical protein [Hydrogenophaga sp.]
MPTLDRRVKGLEDRLGNVSKAEAAAEAERSEKFLAALRALFDACEPKIEEGVHALASRMDAGEMTQADTDLLASLPPFYESPEWLVRAIDHAFATNFGRGVNNGNA